MMKERCQILPLPNHQFQFLVDGDEKTRWHFDPSYPRPFFYPLICESGASLTRMGHPGAPNHDHHRSVWFAHHKVFGHDFWADGKGTLIRQKDWLAIEDGKQFSRLAVELHWLDGHDPSPLMRQILIVEFKPHDQFGWTLELQSTFVPTAEKLELQQTNFGFLAVRMSKQIASYFGGGTLTNSALQESEKNIFGKPAKWMDYSGNQFSHQLGKEIAEGISYIDHPQNPGQPTHWHVREDGWMGASPGMKSSLELTQSDPTTFRYLLWIHSGTLNGQATDALYDRFSLSPQLKFSPSGKPHTHGEISRAN